MRLGGHYELSVYEQCTCLLGGEISDALVTVMGLVKCEDEDDVTAELLVKLNKKQLSDCLYEMTRCVIQCKDSFEKVRHQSDTMKNEHVVLQKQVIEQQNELLKSKSEQLEAVQATVKSEIKSYCDVAKKCIPSSGISITPDQVKKAVKSAVEEEDRTRNIMMFGVVEPTGKEELENKVLDILEHVDEKPRVVECVRIGEVKTGVTRPIKVTVYSADTALRVLNKSGRLKKNEQYRSVYLAADRSVEERAARRKLIEQLRQKRESDPEQYHFVRNDTIRSRSKTSDSATDK